MISNRTTPQRLPPGRRRADYLFAGLLCHSSWTEGSNVTLDEFHQRVTKLKVWRRGGRRAPHKPLLLLLAMGWAVRGRDRLVSFRDVETELVGLLRHFGTPRSPRPVYPFSHLETELWEVPEASSLTRTSGGDFHIKELRERGITGGLPEPLFRELADNPGRALSEARWILDQHFPASMHQHILEAVGLWGVAEAGGHGLSPLPPAPPRPVFPRGGTDRIRAAVRGVRLRPASQGRFARARGCAHPVAFPRWSRSGRQWTGAVYVPSRRVRPRSNRSGGGRTRFRLAVAGLAGGARDEPGGALAPGLPRPPYTSTAGGTREPAGRYVAWHTRQVFRAPPRGRRSAAAVGEEGP